MAFLSRQEQRVDLGDWIVLYTFLTSLDEIMFYFILFFCRIAGKRKKDKIWAAGTLIRECFVVWFYNLVKFFRKAFLNAAATHKPSLPQLRDYQRANIL